MNIENDVKGWLIKAERDLKTAILLANLNEIISDSICFHCQQAVEKYLKAFLIFNKKEFRKTHIIAELLKLCIDLDNEFNLLKEFKIQNLSIYAIEIRYPDDFYIPTINEAKEAIELAIKTKEFVLKKLNEKGFNYE